MHLSLDGRVAKLFRWVIPGLIALSLAQMQAFAGDRGRPHISNDVGFNRLLTDMNTSLRGVSLAWDGGDNANQSDPVNMPTQAQLNALSKTYGLNCIHVYLEMEGQQVGHNAEKCDQLVNMAANADLYVILTIGCGNHNGMILDMNWCQRFWAFWAPRYANRTHVIYESHNEPGPYNPASWSSTDWDNQVTLYNAIRPLAPNTHILTCSFMSFNTAGPALDGITYMKNHGVSFSNASVAWHGYETTESIDACIGQFQAGFGGTSPALLCTEFDPQGTYTGFNNMVESHHIGWVEFIFLLANDQDLTGLLKPAIEGSGCLWTPDYGNWPTPSHSIDPNLAMGKPTTASSVEVAGYEAAKATDGDTTTRWSSAYSDSQWIAVDLGATYTLNQVSLVWEDAYAKSYQIQISTDNVNWTPIYNTTNGKGGTETFPVSGTGRYVRMYGTARATSYGYSLYEFKVFGSQSGFSVKIEAENFSQMAGVQTEACSDTGGGLNVGYIDAGDWMVYPITLPSTGSYTIQYRVASPNTGKSFSADLNAGAIPLGSVSIPNTGGWQNWTTVTQTVTMTAGNYYFGINAGTGGFNVNWFTITYNGD